MLQNAEMTTLEDPRPAPPVGSCRCTVGGTYQTHKWACVFWLNLTSTAPAQADLQTLSGKISSAWNTNMVPVVNTAVIMNSVALVWTPVAGQEILANDATTRTGTGAGTSPAYAGTSVVINHRTGAYYRGGHSRSYVPGIGVNDITNGSTISSAAITSWGNAWSAMVTAIKTGPAGGITAIDVGTVRFRNKNAWLVPPVFTAWQSHAVRQTLGTQRGRLTE